MHTPEPIDPAVAWMEEGHCRAYPPGVFFPSDGAGVDNARRICATCPVQEPCLEYALANRIDHGVWGGCSERERRRIAKRRRGTVAASLDSQSLTERQAVEEAFDRRACPVEDAIGGRRVLPRQF